MRNPEPSSCSAVIESKETIKFPRKKQMSKERFRVILQNFEKNAELNFYDARDIKKGLIILRKVLLRQFKLRNVDLEDMDQRDNDFAI